MPRDSGIEPPTKRRKVGYAHAPGPVNDNISVKRELSPSPPPSLALRTSGAKHIPLPRACRKTQVGWKECRDMFIKEEVAKLTRLGLRVTRKLIRDDGIALDWVSAVPVCPLTLQAPPNVELVRENHIPHTSAPSVISSLDPLGHALRDQTSSAGLPVPRASDAQSVLDISLQETRGLISRPLQEEERTDASNFAVVGAALLKKGQNPNQDPIAHSTPDEPLQSEHRKLIPAELRIPPASKTNKQSYMAWRARRAAWVKKEIEKVEGYTGGHSRGFKYEGNDVIIFLQKHHNHSDNGKQRGKRDVIPPSPASSMRIKDTHTNNGLESEKLKTPTISVGSSQKDALEKTLEAAKRLAASISVVGDKAGVQPQCQPGEAGVVRRPARDLQDISPTSVRENSEADGQLDATQARGLEFLEQYLKMYDHDRGNLDAAYTPNATLSLRTTKGYCSIMNASKVSSQPPMSSMTQVNNTGPTAIVGTLRQLSPHLHHSTLCDIVYNIAALDDMSPGSLLLTCDGVMVHPDHPMQHPEWSFSRTFVLKQNLEENGLVWPMKIVAEKLTIYRTPVL